MVIYKITSIMNVFYVPYGTGKERLGRLKSWIIIWLSADLRRWYIHCNNKNFLRFEHQLTMELSFGEKLMKVQRPLKMRCHTLYFDVSKFSKRTLLGVTDKVGKYFPSYNVIDNGAECLFYFVYPVHIPVGCSEALLFSLARWFWNFN